MRFKSFITITQCPNHCWKHPPSPSSQVQDILEEAQPPWRKVGLSSIPPIPSPFFYLPPDPTPPSSSQVQDILEEAQPPWRKVGLSSFPPIPSPFFYLPPDPAPPSSFSGAAAPPLLLVRRPLA